MENYTEINEIIAKNLIYYRKSAGLTQAELAEKINYSDKSVSKWESGNGVPDIYILMELARLYKITLNDLVGSTAHQENKSIAEKKKTFWARLLIILLSSGIVWLVATVFFVGLQLMNPAGSWWLIFLYAVPCNAILLIVYASIWKYRILNFTAVSTLVWSVLACVYLTLLLIGAARVGIGQDNPNSNFWLLFLLGIPLQGLEILWVFFRSWFRKGKNKEKKQEENAA
jgi:transcriptional regulator with XRE-family HTH domain